MKCLAVIGVAYGSIVPVIAVLVICNLAAAQGRELCVFVTKSGGVEQVNGVDKVPPQYRATARCFSAVGEGTPAAVAAEPQMAAPRDVELTGAERYISMASSVGRMKLRWSRSVERLFTQSPERAMASAARAVSRALKNAAFPPRVQTMDLDWDIVIMDQKVPTTQIPKALVSDCHPGWMTPPAHIYIVADRIVAGCSDSSDSRKRSPDADGRLAEVLIHEMAHVIEYQLAGEHFAGDRLRAEGFATWFQWYAEQYAEAIGEGGSKERMRPWAVQALAKGERAPFRGDGPDYARAGMYVAALVNRRGVAGLVSTYQTMQNEALGFFPAAERRHSWNLSRFHAEAVRLAGE